MQLNREWDIEEKDVEGIASVCFQPVPAWETSEAVENLGHLFLNKVEKLPVIVPTLELQNQFSDFVQAIDKTKDVIKKSLDVTQMLFDNLMQKYFC